MRSGLVGLVLVLGAGASMAGCGDDGDGDGGAGGTGGSAMGSAGDGGGAGTMSSAGTAGTTNEPGPGAAGCTMEDGGTAVTSLCADAPLNALSDAEVAQLCMETGAYVEASIDRAIGCKFVAIVAAASNSSPTEEELQAACTNTETTCNGDDTVPGPGRMTLCGAVPADCTVTVAEYSTCVMEEADVFEREADELVSCSMLTFGNLDTAYDVPTAANESPTCATIKMACRNFTIPYIN